MLQRKLTGTLEPRMVWWALQDRSGRSWKRITTVYERILILYTKKWATNSTKQLKKWVSERVATGGKWGRDCGADRAPCSKQADRGETAADFLGKKRKGRFQTPYTRMWIHWEDQCLQHRTWSLTLHSSDYVSTRWALRSAPQSRTITLWKMACLTKTKTKSRTAERTDNNIGHS